MDNLHLVCFESHFELKWVLYAANSIIIVHVLVCNIAMYIAIVTWKSYLHGRSRLLHT